MSIEANKQLARRFFERISAHDVEGLCALITPDWTLTGGPPGLPAGPEGVRVLFAGFGPIEQTWTLEDVIAEGDRVAVRAINHCKQEFFLGVPSHGRVQVFSATFIHRIADGKIAQSWRNADDLGRLAQLGAQLAPSS